MKDEHRSRDFFPPSHSVEAIVGTVTSHESISKGTALAVTNAATCLRNSFPSD